MPISRTEIDITRQQLSRMRDDVDELLKQLAMAEASWSNWLADVASEHRSSARNMLHYWAIRQFDLRDLQARLSASGLSSLGRSEPHVEATLHLVRAAIGAMLGDEWRQPVLNGVLVNQGPELLRHRTRELLGPDPLDRGTRIMVTLPAAAGDRRRHSSRIGRTWHECGKDQLCARRCRWRGVPWPATLPRRPKPPAGHA